MTSREPEGTHHSPEGSHSAPSSNRAVGICLVLGIALLVLVLLLPYFGRM
ncbi:hypothetical protein ACFP47_01420 [Nesterenkonia lacusekhoensis]|uniref:Uncharacterized protein n=1 Tax=Nesterenkonia lacusekhoensis TaxID=150832 RepID=A0ABS4T4J1_9MICC|nr:hypothetical protein [Nesterenkonia lacusekhoensis]MBP2319369.1 hypothetical protein [Nesterenkonia lacusekhoensis]